MNYFFLCSTDGLSSTLHIPKFQNNGRVAPDMKLFSAKVISGKWDVELVSCDEDQNFFYVNADEQNIHAIYFLATINEVGDEHIRCDTLIDYNNFTKTVPDYRANLSVCNKLGGFSSYQSEYPYGMVNKRGSIISSVGNLTNVHAKRNLVFLKNIYAVPSEINYFAYLVCKQTNSIKKRFVMQTNRLNVINLVDEDCNPNHYLVSDGYLGIPIYLSENASGHLSFEHTHPPHSNAFGPQSIPSVKRLKNELLKIIN